MSITLLFLVSVGLVLIIAVLIILSYLASLAIPRAPFVPIPKEVLPQIIDALKIAPNSVVYDLGCGDGRVLFAGFKREPNATFIGLEKSLFPFVVASSRVQNFQKIHISIYKKNFFSADLSNATRVFLYLFPKLMKDLLPKLERELKPGTRVVSCDFAFTNRQPVETISLNRSSNSLGRTLYVYEF